MSIIQRRFPNGSQGDGATQQPKPEAPAQKPTNQLAARAPESTFETPPSTQRPAVPQLNVDAPAEPTAPETAASSASDPSSTATATTAAPGARTTLESDPALPAAEYHHQSLIGQGYEVQLESLGVTDAESYLALQQDLAAGDEETVLRFTQTLEGDPAAEEAILAQMSRDTPQVRTAIAEVQGGQAEGWPEGVTNEQAGILTDLGVSASDVEEGRAALPDIVAAAQAAQEGDTAAALTHLGNALELAPELTGKVLTALSEKLPDGVLKDVLAYPGTPALLSKLVQGDYRGAAELALADPALMSLMGDSLAELPQVQALFETLGVDPSKLPPLGEVLPDLLSLAGAIQDGDVAEATRATLALGASLDPEAFTELWGSMTDTLPEGARAFLEGLVANPTFQTLAGELLQDPVFPILVAQLAEGDFDGALETLADSPGILDAVGDAILDIPQVRSLVEQLGLDPDQLPGLGAVLPDLIALSTALQNGDAEGAVAATLELAGKLDPELFDSAFTGLYERASALLPPEVKSVLDTLIFDSGLEPAELQQAAQAIPELIRGFQLASEGDWEGAQAAFAAAAEHSAQVAAKLISLWANGLEDGPVKELLQDEALVQELLKAASEVLGALGRGDLPGALSAIAENPALLEALGESPVVTNLLSELGIPEELHGEAMAVLPDLLGALGAAEAGDWPAVMEHLQGVAANAPGLLGHVGEQLAARIELEGPVGDAVRALLSDGELLSAVLSDPELHASLGKILSGEAPVEGVSELLQHEDVARAVWTVLEPQLTRLGLSGPEDLQAIGAALPDFLAAADALNRGQVGEAIELLGAGISKIAPDLVDDLLTRAIDALPIDDAYKGILHAGLDILKTPEGAQALRGMWDAMTATPPDVAAFGAAMRSLGGVIQDIVATDPAKAEQFLNALGALPGKIGALFADEQLNAALVSSGALGQLFEAADHLVHGRYEDALLTLGDAAVSLLGNPPTLEGLESFARLFRQLYESLPNAVKNRVQAAVMSAAGSAFGNIPVIGDLFDLTKDVHKLIEEIRAGDDLGTILAAAQVIIDGGKATQIGKPFLAPLEMAIGIVQGIDDAADAVAEIQDELGNIMLLGEDPTDAWELDQEEREFLVTVTALAEEYGLTSDQVVELMNTYPELKGRNTYTVAGLIQAASAAGVPPEHFGGFVAAVVEDGSSIEEVASALFGIYHHSSGGGFDLARSNVNLTMMLLEGCPATVAYLEQLGIDPVERLVTNLFLAELGREPTADELAQHTAVIEAAHAEDDRWGYEDGKRAVEADLREYPEHPHNAENAA